MAVAAMGQQNNNQGGGSSPIDQVKQQAKQEMQQQGSRQFQVDEKVAWGLSGQPRELLTKAMKNIADEQHDAKEDIMAAAAAMRLQAAAATGPQQQQRQQLEQSAQQLQELAMKVSYKQVLDKDQLKQPFGTALLSLAQFYQAGASEGLNQQQDMEATGYTLKHASKAFQTAHAFLDKKPTEQVSQALYDAENVAMKLISQSRKTTNQAQQANGQTANNEGTGDLADAQAAGGIIGGDRAQQQLRTEAQRAVDQLGQAISSANQGGGQQQQQQ
jgi:CRISPR/Cas system CSM-associated protein Csm2 small subunit